MPVDDKQQYELYGNIVHILYIGVVFVCTLN